MALVTVRLGAEESNHAASVHVRSAAESQVRASDAELAQLNSEAAGLSNQIQALQAQLQSLDRQALLQIEQVEIAQQQYERSSELVTRGMLSQAALDMRRNQYLSEQRNAAALDERKAGLLRQLAELRAAAAAIPGRRARITALSDVAASNSRLATAALESQSRLVVRAPAAGIVGAITARAGEAVQPARPLLQISAGAPIEAEVPIAADALSRVKVGQRVVARLVSTGVGDGRIEGVVASVSETPMPSTTAGEGAADSIRYLVRVRFPPGTRAWPAGAPVRLSIVKDARSLFQRLWDRNEQ
ncbi:HlyD family efflux transporter periplasmic adaptor subunit [Brevundimonas sp. 2R-24]|uniref:HlyD family efflux transporter periplasmic adaptor subunit n=1 Tax=Peiella sedimenti TaxID=3061083 RepID=A0ABT8SQ21_9CAUL|nr:HlyD family efflux transporter periplasmic adaptor subunit [Caulobacteraceae bacterium XZ-24]